MAPPACAGERHAVREERLTLVFFKQLTTPIEEETLAPAVANPDAVGGLAPENDDGG